MEFALANEGDPTRAGRITLSRTTEQIALISGLEVGMKLLLDDGLMEIAVVSRDSAETVKCEVRRTPPVGPGADALGRATRVGGNEWVGGRVAGDGQLPSPCPLLRAPSELASVPPV